MSADASGKDLAADNKDAYTYVGTNGEVYQTYVQFATDSAATKTWESFSCSRVLSVTSEDKEYEVEDDKGYMVKQNFKVYSESIGDALVQNYSGQRFLSESTPSNDQAYNTQLVPYTFGRSSTPGNVSDKNIWFADQQINSTVFLQQGYKNGSRVYNCVAQRMMNNSDSAFQELKVDMSLTFIAGYKIYPSETGMVSTNVVSNELQIMVQDAAMTLAATSVVAAAALLAF